MLSLSGCPIPSSFEGDHDPPFKLPWRIAITLQVLVAIEVRIVIRVQELIFKIAVPVVLRVLREWVFKSYVSFRPHFAKVHYHSEAIHLA